ncbi:MAG: hypothetical protein EA376_05475 [Phycisphaeraceae bacterium]|nr:MAG: hypothetical protein EA376_05475 [Phycisphaeraceae bacterium]
MRQEHASDARAGSMGAPSIGRTLALGALAAAAALGAAAHEDAHAGVTLYEGPVTVIPVELSQAVGSSPQAMMVAPDGEGDVVLFTATGAGTSVIYDAETFEFLSLGSVGFLNGLDYNAKTGIFAGSSISANWGYGTEPDQDQWTVLPSGFVNAQAIAAADDYVLLFGTPSTGGRALAMLDYVGNVLGQAVIPQEMIISDASHLGNGEFLATWRNTDTLERYLSRWQYTLDDQGEIHLVETQRCTIEGFNVTTATLLGVHQDAGDSRVYFGINNSGNLMIARGHLAPPPAPCAADLTGDGGVGSADLGVLLGAWGQAGSDADINGDGVVNSLDLAILLGSWGPCE